MTEPIPARQPYFTAREVAARMQVSERSVRRWIAEGRLRAHHFGRSVRVAWKDVQEFERQSRR